MRKLKAHLFVCTNKSKADGCCGAKNSEVLRAQLKEQCKMEPWSKEVRVNASGCLGHCERGISAVLYPQGEWFFDLTDSSTDLLFAAVKAAVEKSK